MRMGSQAVEKSSRRRLSLLGGVAVLALVASLASTAVNPVAASAVPTDGATAAGRATGSGKWGYIGQFGQLNKTTQATAGQFFLPYGIDINGSTIAVTDSGLSFEETGSKTIGHTVQTFTLDHSPGSAGHGDYLGNGQYDVVTNKSSIADPADIVTPLGLIYYPEGQVRGPRGVVVADDGTIAVSLHDDVNPRNNDPHLLRYGGSSFAPFLNGWGTSQWASNPGREINPIQLAGDSAGRLYSASESAAAVNVFASDGTFLSSVGYYFDGNGESWSTKITWANRATEWPANYNNPHLIGTPHGVSVLENGDGTLTVYVADASGYYQADPALHFPGGSSTAQYIKPASIKKYIVTTSGGTVNPTFNPAGWQWTLDTTFGTGGQVAVGTGTLLRFGASYFWSPQIAWALAADPGSERVFYAMGAPGGGVPVVGTLNGTTGAAMPGPAQVNSPGAQNDSRLSFSRGVAVDDRGLLYATSQSVTNTGTNRSIVQIFGMTPSPVPSAAATPSATSAAITWGASVVGHAQPDLLDYVVRYRVAGGTTWTTVPAATPTSTATSRTITGLAEETDYEVCITPWNEAGSGDAACATFTTLRAMPALSVTKTGNDVAAPTADDAVAVAAGSTVNFQYVVTNSGDVPLTGVTLVDSMLTGPSAPVAVLPTPFDGTLAPGESVTFEASGPVAAGAYLNTATASSTESADATAVWHGFGVTTNLAVQKFGNDAFAPDPANPFHVGAGTTVTFKYVVTNAGNSPVRLDSVTDSVLGVISAPSGFSGVLGAGESVTYEASGTVAEGAYRNDVAVAATQLALNTALSASTTWYGYGDADDSGISRTGGSAPLVAGSIAMLLLVGGGVMLAARRRRSIR